MKRRKTIEIGSIDSRKTNLIGFDFADNLINELS